MRIHKLDAIGPLTAPGSLGLTTPGPPSQALLMGLFFRPNPIGQSNHRVLYYLTAFQKIRSPVIIMVQRRLIFDPESFTSCRNFFSLFFSETRLSSSYLALDLSAPPFNAAAVRVCCPASVWMIDMIRSCRARSYVLAPQLRLCYFLLEDKTQYSTRAARGMKRIRI